MRTVLMVMFQEFTSKVIQMPGSKEKEVIQAIPLQ